MSCNVCEPRKPFLQCWFNHARINIDLCACHVSSAKNPKILIGTVPLSCTYVSKYLVIVIVRADLVGWNSSPLLSSVTAGAMYRRVRQATA